MMDNVQYDIIMCKSHKQYWMCRLTYCPTYQTTIQKAKVLLEHSLVNMLTFSRHPQSLTTIILFNTFQSDYGIRLLFWESKFY